MGACSVLYLYAAHPLPCTHLPSINRYDSALQARQVLVRMSGSHAGLHIGVVAACTQLRRHLSYVHKLAIALISSSAM